MRSPSVFAFEDYKAYLRALLEGRRGMVGQLAAAAGCQRSYLSRALNADAHLTPDHAHGIAGFLHLNPEETEYFFTLLERARAGTKAYREHLTRKMTHLRKARLEVSNRLKRPVLADPATGPLYYSAWYWSAIHIAVSIPALRTERALARALELPEPLVHSALLELERLGLVTRDGTHWRHGSGDLHVPRNSPLVGMHHGNWRQRAVLDAQRPDGDGLHYTVVQAMSDSVFRDIRKDLLELIERAAATAGESPSERLVCFCMDLF
jgi:hypothetical protein